MTKTYSKNDAISFYDTFAKYYDAIRTEQAYEKETEFIEKLLDKKRIDGTIVDVCCGTGEHLRLLSKKHEVMAGIDISKKMLSIAKNKLKDVDFIWGSMEDFKLSKKADLIICMYGTINYILKEKDIMKTIKNFYDNLNEGGAVVIDIRYNKNLPEGSKDRIIRTRDGTLKLSMQWVRGDSMRASLLTRLTFYRKNQENKEYSFRHEFNFMDPYWMKKQMGRIGFRVEIYDGYDTDKSFPSRNNSYGACLVGFK